MPLVTVRSASSLPQLSEEDINGNGIDLLVSDRERPRKETPYSRSPALRISHKLAERKRRKEMKCLFDELRDALPVEKNMKTSKWEILSKAVEYISLLKRRDYDLENEINELRREIDAIKRERTSNYTPPYYSS
ncbi:Putative HLH domain-containing protein [Rhizopus microsporus]|nr:Putative HLH domain-containing protein [Rhizopus microsporus]